MAGIGKLDPDYFDASATWENRVHTWISHGTASEFWQANASDLTRRIKAATRGARAAVNIGANALLKLLRGERYKNAYILAEEANARRHVVVGAEPGAQVDKARTTVDNAFGLAPPKEFFFAAVTMEGTGVRYYGDYCIILGDEPTGDTQIVDRDSYEILFEPLDSHPPAQLAAALRGTWSRDLASIAVLKVRRVLERTERITTSVSQAHALLEGEEFIEIHLRLAAQGGGAPGFAFDAIEEVRQDSRDIAASERIDTLFESGQFPRAEDLVYTLRRRAVERELDARGVRSRVVREERGA